MVTSKLRRFDQAGMRDPVLIVRNELWLIEENS